jgi:hypothetical protein
MSGRLVLTERPSEGGKRLGENVLLDDIPGECKVYAFYYPGEMRNNALEKRLRELGKITGENLFVNIGALNDPRLGEIQKRFGIRKYPVIVVTAIDALASPANEYLTAYARLDSKHLLDSPDRTIECVQELFNLFIQGRVSEAIARAKWQQRSDLLSQIGNFFVAALKGIGDFILDTDISVSFVEGKLELKRSKG